MRFLFDEDLNRRILRGLLRRIPDLDFRSAHDPDLLASSDNEILAIAAADRRLVVSHDVNTMTAAFQARLDQGKPVFALLLIPQRLAIGVAIADLELICMTTDETDWHHIMAFLPL